jgi:hypothetical protein
MRRGWVVLWLFLGLWSGRPAGAWGAGPAEELFRLVPPDAGVTLIVEDLRVHAPAFFASPLCEGLRGLPAVKAWLASDKAEGLRQARRRIEKLLGEPITVVRNDLLGDAVVLALHLPPGATPDEARGLLLTRVRNRALLDRLVEELNSAQTRKGELARVGRHSWHGSSYSSREYHDGKKPAEYYTTLPDDTFAWSNSEDLIRGLIDRKAEGSGGLGDDPRFRQVRRKLPAGAVATLYVDPRFLERVRAASPRSGKPGDEQVQAMLGRYLAAVEYAGAALEWQGGLTLQTEETLDRSKLDGWIKKWAARPGKVEPAFRRVPATAMAVATVSVDFAAVLDAFEGLFPGDGRAKLANGLEVLRGVLLGRDLQSAILPYVGPGVLAYVEPPAEGESKPGLPAVLAVQVGGDAGVAAALDNALRTALALYALDEKHDHGRLRVVSREVTGRRVTSLDPSTPFAYAMDGGRLVIGSTPEAVARSFTAGGDMRFERLRKAHFPDAQSFACVDLVALRRFAETHRAALVRQLAAEHHRPEEAEVRDLEQVLALMELFEGAYLTSAVSADATSVHRTLGMIGDKSTQLNRP